MRTHKLTSKEINKDTQEVKVYNNLNYKKKEYIIANDSYVFEIKKVTKEKNNYAKLTIKLLTEI